MLRHLASEEKTIFIIGILLLLSYLGVIIGTYLFSVNSANHLIILTVTNFLFGRAAGISYGFSVGFDDLVIIAVNIVIELIIVLLIYPLFVLSWRKSLSIKGLHSFFSKVKELRITYNDFFTKYGKYGLFVFVWFPFWMTGPVVGSIIGFLIGLKHHHTMLIVISGTSFAIVVWTYFLKELISFLDQISAYAPHILLGLFILIALIFKLLRSKK